MTEERNIRIGGDAEGNVIVTGDSNSVVIIHAAKVLEPAQTPTADSIGPNPYKGLAAFQESDANYFFGREDLTDRLWVRFRQLHEQQPGTDKTTRVLPILGPSGSGKSSVARAGLIPELARRPFPAQGIPRVAVFTPGAHPLESLATILARVTIKEDMPVAKVREFVDQLRLPTETNEYDGLRRIAAASPETSNAPLIILVDQFEEIYSLCDDDKQRNIFIENILNAASDKSARVSIILTLRTDFIGHTNSNEELSRIIANQGVIVPVMNRQELTRAIAEPARISGKPLDDATVELLINESRGREGVLPLLQFSLTRIWEGMTGGVAPAETLREIGGVGGALAREAQRLYEGLQGDTDKELARRTFLSLVRVGQDIPTTRRTLAIADLVGKGDDFKHVRDVLERFASPGARIITLSSNAEGVETAKISHEALIDHWTEFEEWIRDAYDDLLFQYRIEEAARYWNDQKRPSGLLWRPPDLDRLKTFRKRLGHSLTQLQVDFADASQKANQRSRIFKVAGIGLPIILSVVVGVGLWKVLKKETATPPNTNDSSVNQNVNENDDTEDPDSSDPYGRISPSKMAPKQLAAVEMIKTNAADAFKILNEEFGMNLAVPQVYLIKDEGVISSWNSLSASVSSRLAVKDFPEITYHDCTYAFLMKVGHLEAGGDAQAVLRSYADIYTELISQQRLNQTATQADWLIAPGAAAVFFMRKGRAFASMKDPGTAYEGDREVAHMSKYLKGDENTTAFVNVGIPNKAFYQAAISIGTDKAAAIWKAALPKLHPKCSFENLANITFREAGKRHGENSQEQSSIKQAWATVGISVR